MPPRKKEIVVGFVSAAIIFFVLFFAGLYILGDPVLHQTAVFSRTVHSILADYYEPGMGRPALDEAESALLSLLDPFSQRLDRKDYKQLREEFSGEYSGVGITIVPRDTLLMIISVHEGGPAYDGGVKSGDWILAVDGVPIPRHNPAGFTDRIRGPSGTEVSLTLYRPRIDDTLQITLTRGMITLEHVPYYGMTERGNAFIRIADFESGAADQLRAAVEKLEPKEPGGYIIDLKANPGGYLDEAIEAADLFLEKGTLIVGIDSRSRWDNREFKSRVHPLTHRPIIILTDRGSASGSEIFTGALRGADRAVVVGDTTFGKGLVQAVYPLFNGDALRLTISRYYFADSTYLNPPDSELHFSGLPPDIVYHPTGEIAFQDLILSGMLFYDFVDAHWELLSRYPDRFNYPDTVIAEFENFADSRGIRYQSWLTETLEYTVIDQLLEEASDPVIAHLDSMLSRSRALDADVFARHADFLKFHIRTVVVERKHGRAASYRDVIVTGRADIRVAEDLLLDETRYREYLASRTTDK
ncbi:MAG: S41 family peptidase [Candidatus Thorarchaeota archaeon]